MKNPCHPGAIIKDCLDDLNLNVTQAAEVLGITRTTLSRLLHTKTNISDEMAIRLSKAFGSTPAFWLRLQLNYDLMQIEKKSLQINVKCYIPEHRAMDII